MSSLVLKIIAIVTMVLDHVGYFVYDLPIPYSYELHMIFRIIGRISMPIFCFLIAEGFRKTRNPYRYAVRLAVAALASEIPYNLCFWSSPVATGSLNVMFTLLLGLIGLILYKLVLDKTKLPSISALTLIPVCLVTYYIGADYSFFAPLFIFFFYIASPEMPNGRLLTFIITVIFGFREVMQFGLLYFISIALSLMPFLPQYTPSGLSEWSCVQIFAAVSAVLLFLYNGKPGRRPEGKLGRLALKYSFYVFYPLHLIVLWIVFGLIIK